MKKNKILSYFKNEMLKKLLLEDPIDQFYLITLD